MSMNEEYCELATLNVVDFSATSQLPDSQLIN